MIIGVISDTHGLLRPDALAALAGCELIIHAGDVGSPWVLDALAEIAPVVAVRGNCDAGPWAGELPETETVHAGGVAIRVIHDLKQLVANSDAEGIGVVISGHSHAPLVERRGKTLYLNPGSAGKRRFDLPISLARLEVCDGKASAAIIVLEE